METVELPRKTAEQITKLLIENNNIREKAVIMFDKKNASITYPFYVGEDKFYIILYKNEPMSILQKFYHTIYTTLLLDDVYDGRWCAEAIDAIKADHLCSSLPFLVISDDGLYHLLVRVDNDIKELFDKDGEPFVFEADAYASSVPYWNLTQLQSFLNNFPAYFVVKDPFGVYHEIETRILIDG